MVSEAFAKYSIEAERLHRSSPKLGTQKHPTKSNLNWVLGGSPRLKLR
jgi:hypothetical protein